MESKIECILCGEHFPEDEVCSAPACLECHVSITFEDCINNTTPDELAWEERKKSILGSTDDRA